MAGKHDSTFIAYAMFGMLCVGACGGSTPTAPSSHAVVTFTVGSESFRISLTTSDQVTAARAVWYPLVVPAARNRARGTDPPKQKATASSGFADGSSTIKVN